MAVVIRLFYILLCVPITVGSAHVCVKDGFQSTAVPHAELL